MNIKGRLEDWQVVTNQGNPYIPPEACLPYIEAVVYDCEDIQDGKHISTSTLKAETNDPSVIETASGSFYKLGEPRPSYVKWCRENGSHVPTKEEPIRWKS